ncbi:MAG TPA: hypothetical protein VMS74_03935 [Acidimicrobiia bacterium]|nr:hypothetical protein [Acidimicrobiia bacterium]
MRRLAFVSVIALAGLATFVVSDLLEPEAVPVAGVIELSGTAPATSPPAEGFFIVPPRVVDFREPSDDDSAGDDDQSPAEIGGDNPDDSLDDSDDSFDDD